jgi:hypothetical protein
LTVKDVTASEAPAIGNPKLGDVGSFELICNVAANVPEVAGGWNMICTVHESPAATVGETEAQGFDPRLAFNMKLGSAGARKEIAATLNAAVPLFLIVTSSGAGRLLVVTLPKSNVAGTTWRVGLVTGGGVGVGVGAGAGAGPGLGPLPPALHPATAIVAAANSTGSIDKRCFITAPFQSEVAHADVCSIEMFQTRRPTIDGDCSRTSVQAEVS